MFQSWPRALLTGAIFIAIATHLTLSAAAQSQADIITLNRQVERLYKDGKYAEAAPIAEQALALAERVLGKEHPDTLTGVKNLADVYDAQARHDAAEPLFKRALEARERVLGQDHPDTLVSVNDLAVLYQTRGRHGEAEPLFKRALAARERVLGANHPDTLQSVENLAVLYEALGRDGEAEPLFKRALEAQTRTLGKDHADTLATVNDLAHFYQTRKRISEAEPLLRRAFEYNDRALGRENTATLLSAGALAKIYLDQRRFGEAEPLLGQILEGFERTLGADHPNTLEAANALANVYQFEGRYNVAEPLFKRVLDARERVLGRENPTTIESVSQLARLYQEQNRNGEAEPLYKRALEARQRLLGKEHADTLRIADDLADLYVAMGRLGEAEPIIKANLAIKERVFGSEHQLTLRSVNSLADLYRSQGHYDASEPLFERVLAARRRLLGDEHPDTLATLNGLAQLYVEQGRDGEAEPILKHALETEERALGNDAQLTIAGVNNLASLYFAQGRYTEAEPLYRRAAETLERVSGRDHPATLGRLINLAGVYQEEGRYADAEALYLRALKGFERARGPDHPETLVSVNNLAELYRRQNRFVEAEALYQRARQAFERVLGKEHPNTLSSLSNLAELYAVEGRYGEASDLLLGELEVSERVFGADAPKFGVVLNNLAMVHFLQSDWRGAAQFWRRSTAAIVRRMRRGTQERELTGKTRNETERLSWQFSGLVKAVYRLAKETPASEPEAARETFQSAQWALNSEAARSLAQMAARGAKGDPALAALARERQDLLGEWQSRDVQRNAALGEPAERRNAKAEAENRDRLSAIEERIAAIDARLTAEYPDYAALANPSPLSANELQAQLGADEALILFLDTPGEPPTPEETFIWVVTKTALRWVRSDLGGAALGRQVQALRCGLDEEEWATPTRASRCGELLALTAPPEASRPLPFDLGKAHALYQGLFGQIEDLIAGKRLIIVPSGPLTSLPFDVLVTKKPASALPETFDGYRGVSWLGRQNAIMTLPAVSSLKALRQRASNSEATVDTYAGYGDPVLKGGGFCAAIESPTECPSVDGLRSHAIPVGRATVRSGGGGRRSVNATMDDVFLKGAASASVLEQVRSLCPLPDTAYEIKCVAERFKDKAPLIRLEGEATETDLKALSASGKLARYRILHFATHGLLSGDVERMAKRQGEPALVLTPPDKPADADDDGLLTASEVAALKLNADWVVLSACNTAAGEKVGAEALSGLARAFFYAGARALLVSHWPVYSDAAVRLTTRAFAELERNPKLGRAETLRQSMIALMDDRSQADNAHPAVWAPFAVVGEGGR